MSRTRLDEIVEEELERGIVSTDSPLTYGKRIAERAFRHGVEQAKVAARLRPDGVGMASQGGYNIAFGDVQPAPAEEKCSHCGRVHEPPIACDRRKGQRRKP